MLSIVIPTLNAETGLGDTLNAVAGASEIIVADGGSTDGTPRLAESKGARVVNAPRGRGSQLAAGAAAATGDRLLFLHADTVPGPGWQEAVEGHDDPDRAAYFRFALADDSSEARRLERRVAWRCRTFGLPYGDQGLLVSRRLYDAVGGFRPIPIMEDVDIVRRIGKNRLVALDVPAVTSAERFRRDGYRRRSLRNLSCLALWFLGVPSATIARLYR